MKRKRNKRIMKKEELVREIDLFIILAIFFILVFLFIKAPTITGFIIYTSASYNWTFENSSNYIYDENLLLIENNSAQLKLQEETYNWTTINISEFYIESAYQNNNDKTSKVISLDNDFVKIENGDMFNVTFTQNLNNNDIISFYIKGNESNIYLCPASNFCEDDNYSSIYFDGQGKDWYNITIQNLPSPINTLAILNDNKVKFDYINVISQVEEIHYRTNYTYPDATSLETSNLDLPSINNLNYFSKDEQLNQQQINYYYSSDNGINWILIEENGSIPSNLEQIKIKAEFNSNKINTPILYSMSLSYQYCIENWECCNWSDCYENNTKSRTCTDLNDCNTEENKPIEIENCTYSPPSEETSETPSSISSSGGGGSSKAFTRPTETTEETITPTETPKIKEELPEKTEAPKIKQETPLQKFTGFVSYNIGKDGISIIGLAIFVLISTFLIKRSKRI